MSWRQLRARATLARTRRPATGRLNSSVSGPMKNIRRELINSIVSALRQAEDAGDIVICTTTPELIANPISDSVRTVFTGDIFSPEELFALSKLISQATSDKRFYDWEMPTLIGYTADEMAELGERIRQLTAL